LKPQPENKTPQKLIDILTPIKLKCKYPTTNQQPAMLKTKDASFL